MTNSSLSQNQNRPILIVDKAGQIGPSLARKLSEHFIVVLVTPKAPKSQDSIVHVPFLKKIPTIPDNYYSYIFLIDDGKVLLHSVASFIKKASADQSRAILIEGIRSSNPKTVDESRFYRNANVFFYGDLFSQDQYLSEVSDYFSQIKSNKKIDIEGEGLDHLYPIYLEDFLESLIEQVFVKNNSAKFINVFPKNPITKLGLARILSSLDPLIKTDFVKQKNKQLPAKIESGDYVLSEKYDPRSEFKKILEQEEPQDFKKEESLNSEIEETSFLRSALIFVVLFILFFVSLPLITTFFYSGLGLYEIDSLRKNFDKGSISDSYKSAKNSNNFFNLASKTLVPLKTELSLIGQEKYADQIGQKIYLGQSISEASMDLISSSQKIEAIAVGNSSSPSDDFDQAMSSMKNAITQFRRIEAQASEYPELAKKISDISPVVDLISNSANMLPQILGFEGEKKYLVLFQNNMELRPGGGFIGSYGILTMKNAVTKDFKIYNVYDADGQLKGHIEPPFPIRKYLPQPNWYLRDSNFDPDFANNASSAAFFLNLETGEKVDGVVAVDLTFVKQMLSAIGPINVSDYNVTVDSSNLFQITEEKAQKNSFAGSTQKQDFLSALFKAVQVKIGENKSIPYISLASAISNALTQKHILLASNQSGIQAQLAANNWSSQIPSASASAANTFNDFVGINEANLGINKVNYLVSRSISKAQMIGDDGALSSAVSVSYKNGSKKEIYKNYIRFILPSSASVSQISFDNVVQEIIPVEKNPSIYESKNYRSPVGLQVDNYQQNGKTIVGFLVEVLPDSLKTISVTYSLNQILSLGPQFNYNLNIFKQAGTDSTPVDLSIYYPKSYALINKSDKIISSDNKVSISGEINSDTQFNFSFGQK